MKDEAFKVDLLGHPIKEEAKVPNKSDVTSEVAPGQFISHLDVWELPSYVVSKLVPNGDGTYRLEAVEEWFGWIPVGEVRRRLGIKGMSEQTLHRLCTAGWVEHIQPTPQCFLLKIDSLVEHLERTKNTRSRENTWWTEQRRQQWRHTCGL